MSKFLRLIVNLFLLCAIAVAAAILVPPLVGVGTTIVDSQRMSTNLPMGSVTYAMDRYMTELVPGDKVITDDDASAYVYVIDSADTATGEFVVHDPYEAGAESRELQILGTASKVVVTVPFIGYIVYAMHSIEGLIILALVLLLMIILFILSELWRKDGDEDEYEAEEYVPEVPRENYGQDLTIPETEAYDLQNEVDIKPYLSGGPAKSDGRMHTADMDKMQDELDAAFFALSFGEKQEAAQPAPPEEILEEAAPFTAPDLMTDIRPFEDELADDDGKAPQVLPEEGTPEWDTRPIPAGGQSNGEEENDLFDEFDFMFGKETAEESGPAAEDAESAPVFAEAAEDAESVPVYTEAAEAAENVPVYTEAAEAAESAPVFTEPAEAAESAPVFTEPAEAAESVPVYTEAAEAAENVPVYTEAAKIAESAPVFTEPAEAVESTPVYGGTMPESGPEDLQGNLPDINIEETQKETGFPAADIPELQEKETEEDDLPKEFIDMDRLQFELEAALGAAITGSSAEGEGSRNAPEEELIAADEGTSEGAIEAASLARNMMAAVPETEAPKSEEPSGRARGSAAEKSGEEAPETMEEMSAGEEEPSVPLIREEDFLEAVPEEELPDPNALSFVPVERPDLSRILSDMEGASAKPKITKDPVTGVSIVDYSELF